MAQPFDPERLELMGDAVPVADQVRVAGATGTTGAFSVSETGALVYQTGSANVSQLVWFDRTGKQIGVLGDQADYGDVELSPDGARTAVSFRDPARNTRDIWLYDVARDLRTRLTFDAADELPLIWSPDGTRVVFNSRRKGKLDLYQKSSNGTGTEDVLLEDSLVKWPLDWSDDGQFILYASDTSTRDTGGDLWVLPLGGDRKPYVFLQTPFSEGWARFSPDGRWVAYRSDESGRNEVYVAPFSRSGGTLGGKWQISTGGGDLPRWRRDGKEMFYLALDDRLMSVAIDTTGVGFEVGAVRPLFETRAKRGLRYSYDVSADGEYFLINTTLEAAEGPITTLVVNWPALLKK